MSDFGDAKEEDELTSMRGSTTTIKSGLWSLPSAIPSRTDWTDKQKPNDFDSLEGSKI
jgi:hypothetical protein